MDSFLKYPLILIGKDKAIEIITKDVNINYTTKLSVKRNKLIGAIIYTSDEKCYVVSKVEIIRNLNPWWKFEFFNPGVEIRSEKKEIVYDFQKLKQDLINSISEFPQYWDDSYNLNDIFHTINRTEKFSEIISYLMSLRGL